MPRKKTIPNTVYIARDLERALGLPLNTPNYYIISNFSAFAKSVVGTRKNILLVKSREILDTRELLARPEVHRFINGIKKPQILVFKPTVKIQKICADNNWKLLNPSADLAARVEEKISQVEWLGPLAKKLLPPFEIKECGKIKWTGQKFILQFNLAHTGAGTMLVESKKQLDEIKKKFSKRPARVTKYIIGPMFTNNNVVWDNQVLVGNINYQITGLKPFTNNRFATVGNDWTLPHKILTGTQKKQYENIATAVGKRLAAGGWKGLFGVDVVMDAKTKKMYLIEINARQPASTAYESQLQSLSFRAKRSGVEESLNAKFITTFTAHLLALSGVKYSGQKLIKIKTGAQVVQRVLVGRKTKLSAKEIKELTARGFKIFFYSNVKSESDAIRFQIKESLVAGHNKLNELGKFLSNLLKKS